jgi:hypothetical protein
MMTLHPQIKELRELVESESETEAAERIRAHIAGCASCSANVDWLNNTMKTLQELPVRRAPEGVLPRIAERVAAGETVLLPAADAPSIAVPKARSSVGHGLRAAILLIAIAGAASATIPGSPVHAWIERLFAPARSSPPPVQPAPAAGEVAAPPAPAPQPAPQPADAVFLVPAASGALSIAIESPDPRLRIRVRLSDALDIEVRATGAASSAQFRSGPGRLGISGGGPGEIMLSIPRSATPVTLTIDGRVYLEKGPDRINILAPTADTAGAEIVFQARAEESK